MKNLKLQKKIDITSNTEINDAIKDAENALGDTGRVVLRNSGTEPLVRVMVEGENLQQVEFLVNELLTKVSEVVENHYF
jgi:phosphoglucosamine mutase